MNERERLSKEIDKCLAGELDRFDSVKIIDHTPLILQKCGLEDKPILMSQHHIKTCMHPKGKNIHWHGLEKQDIVDLQDVFCEPAMILDSFSDDYSVIAVTNRVDRDGLPIMGSIQCNGIGNYECRTIKSNYLTSVYGKNNFDNFFKKSIDADFVLYVNKEKTQELESFAKLQLLRECSNLELNFIIHKSENVVNGEIKPILDTSKVQEFNQKWENRGFSIGEGTKGFGLWVPNEEHIGNKAVVLTLTKDGNINVPDKFIVAIKTINWILPEEKEFYKNNPDVCDNWNEQRKAFNSLRRELVADVERMFAPREDQMEVFYKATEIIKQKMNDEFLGVAGYESVPGKKGCIQKIKSKNPSVDLGHGRKRVETKRPEGVGHSCNLDGREFYKKI